MKLRGFTEIWLVAFEFTAFPGHHPTPIVMVARELISGCVLRIAADALVGLRSAPFDTGPDSLFVAYYASAEFSCFLALSWELPVNVIDLFAEFRNISNGLEAPSGPNLLGALLWFRLPPGDAVENLEMCRLASRGGPFTDPEITALTEYCQSYVEALSKLWGVMAPRLDTGALLRGCYMKAAARMEWVGIPLDMRTHRQLEERLDDFKDHLIHKIDPTGTVWRKGKFSQKRFAHWLQSRGIHWPCLRSGKPALDKETWSDMAKLHPSVRPFTDLRATLSSLRQNKLAVGPDGRNRTLLSAFRSTTGRNQPSTAKFIFGTASWLRCMIQPAPGWALAYIDWSQQEFGIAAFLSGDPAMQDAYRSSDPYMAFAKLAGAAPEYATKESHPEVRRAYKLVVLAVGYGMTAHGLAQKLGTTVAEAEALLQMHRRCYPDFWKWLQGAADFAQLHGRICTRYGWGLHFTLRTKDRSVRNFPCQANGAEMMRLAAIYATSAGIKVCAPVHDAFLIEAPEPEIVKEVTRMQACMARASAGVLSGFELKTEVDIVRYPERFGRGNAMWDLAMEFFASSPPKLGEGTPP